jgi:hypothetical protein
MLWFLTTSRTRYEERAISERNRYDFTRYLKIRQFMFRCRLLRLQHRAISSRTQILKSSEFTSQTHSFIRIRTIMKLYLLFRRVYAFLKRRIRRLHIRLYRTRVKKKRLLLRMLSLVPWPSGWVLFESRCPSDSIERVGHLMLFDDSSWVWASVRRPSSTRSRGARNLR